MISVKQRQYNLKHYYLCYVGNIDGVEGTQTKQAYKTFQKMTGISADGIYGQDTEKHLIEAIKQLQKLLNKKGYKLVVDGFVGTNTINAIRDFQKKNGLTVDGIVGKKTFAKLKDNTYSWDKVKYFKKSEFTCQCGCGLNNIDLNLVKILDSIREHYNKPLHITSGCRCVRHNSKVGGVQGSRHTKGKAADFYIDGVSINTLLNYCKKLVSNGTIRYTYTNNTNMNGVVHIDIF